MVKGRRGRRKGLEERMTEEKEKGDGVDAGGVEEDDRAIVVEAAKGNEVLARC